MNLLSPEVPLSFLGELCLGRICATTRIQLASKTDWFFCRLNHYIYARLMQKKLILDSDLFDLTISRLCQQLIENHNDFSNTVILGMQPRGIFVADIIHDRLTKDFKREIP